MAEHTTVHGRNGKGEPICAARRKSGGKCQTTKLMRGGRCRLHGGKSLAGLESPSLRHGKFSKDLPKGIGILHRYEAALADPDLLNLRSELALMDARIAELLSQLDGGAGKKAWRAADAHLEAVRVALDKKDGPAAAAGLVKLKETLSSGLAEASVWSGIHDAFNLKRKLLDTETRRERTLHQSVALGQVMNLVNLIASSIHANITDRKVLAAIQGDMQRGLKLVGASTA
ncbi:MAG: hypothetical protein Q8T13_04995 [Acidobacteriota bacterium]|nr:hypothetical protein [Acidobacteriota bacterium]